jgi:hypothetical protein
MIIIGGILAVLWAYVLWSCIIKVEGDVSWASHIKTHLMMGVFGTVLVLIIGFLLLAYMS